MIINALELWYIHAFKPCMEVFLHSKHCLCIRVKGALKKLKSGKWDRVDTYLEGMIQRFEEYYKVGLNISGGDLFFFK